MIDRSKFKPTSLLHIHKEIFNEEIDYFQKYIVEVSYQFEKRTIELNDLYVKAINDYDDQLDEEYKINIQEFPKILNSSILITVQTILEKTLKNHVNLSLKMLGLTKRKKTRQESDISFYPALFTNIQTGRDFIALRRCFGQEKSILAANSSLEGTDIVFSGR